jgi:hypothetical protein
MRDHIGHLERALNLRHPEVPKSLAEVFTRAGGL